MQVSGTKSTVQTKVDVSNSDVPNRLNTKIDAEVKKLEASDAGANVINPQSFGDRHLKGAVDVMNKKVQVRGWDPEKRKEITARIETKLESNPEIQLVDIAEENVDMEYVVFGKFFGFIHHNMKMRIFADAKARVKVKFPWYKFMVKTNFSNAAQTLNEVFQHNQTDLEFLKSQEVLERQIQIFLKISNTMHEMSKGIIGNIKA